MWKPQLFTFPPRKSCFYVWFGSCPVSTKDDPKFMLQFVIQRTHKEDSTSADSIANKLPWITAPFWGLKTFLETDWFRRKPFWCQVLLTVSHYVESQMGEITRQSVQRYVEKDAETESIRVQTFCEWSTCKSRVSYFLQEKDSLVISSWIENLDPLANSNPSWSKDIVDRYIN